MSKHYRCIWESIRTGVRVVPMGGQDVTPPYKPVSQGDEEVSKTS